MPFSSTLTPHLSEDLPHEASERLEVLANHSPLYKQFLNKHPEYWAWVEKPENLNRNFRYSALESVWAQFCKEEEALPFMQRMRRFRRLISMRIAYRELNGLSSIETSLSEQTRLAEFCLTCVCETFYADFKTQYGEPHNDAGKPSAYTVIALGKLGGQELNFCSDVDLIYAYSGGGYCLKGARQTSLSAQDFFIRFFQKITMALQKQTDEGFLYHVDLRLRPEGEAGPLACTASKLEQYYWQAGQTWERMALLKARPIAGDKALGEELMEALNPFRYPRSAQANFLEEVALVKTKIDAEDERRPVEDNIKKGHGGIREIEFIVQAMQLLHAGKNPFLQTTSTLEALAQLSKYNILNPEEYQLLQESYLLLRAVENRLQMKEEQQTHVLPKNEEAEISLLQPLSQDKNSFHTKRAAVRALYEKILPQTDLAQSAASWIGFLSGKSPEPKLALKLSKWFGEGEETQYRFRTFLCSKDTRSISPEFLRLLLVIVSQFETLLPTLATPLETLERVGAFAQRYGSRKQFFKACGLNPALLESLCYLFDRSPYIFELLSRHPELIEELMYEANRKLKSVEELTHEMKQLPTDDKFEKYLWLYVKTEQVRIILGQVLWHANLSHVEQGLSDLADAAVQHILSRVDPKGTLAVVACGKWGAQSLTLGSDLDLLFFTQEAAQETLAKAQQFLRLMQKNHGGSPLYEIDMRLRPYGQDGPLTCTLDSFRMYHHSQAKLWERQLLIQARVVQSAEEFTTQWTNLHTELLYTTPITTAAVNMIWEMRIRLEMEKTKQMDPFRHVKAGPGGLMDIQFFVEAMQLKWGPQDKGMRQKGVTACLMHLAQRNIIPERMAARLIEHYNFLRRIEHLLRTHKGQPINTLEKDNMRIARLMGYPSSFAFWKDYQKRAKGTRNAVEACLSGQMS